MTDVSALAAFVAGVLSISSPCVLPLIPVYLIHLAGVSAGDTTPRARARVLANAGAYVLGFSAVFVLLGVALGVAGSLVAAGELVSGNRGLLVRVGGVVMVLLGLHQIGVITLPWLGRERRMSVDGLESGNLASSFVIGVTFGAGWSPCVGPILGGILTMATVAGGVGQSAWLLTLYSLGLGVPFMVFAVAFGSAQRIARWLNARLTAVTSVSGAIMVAAGAIMLLGIYERLFAELVRVAPWTPWEPRL
jgi:cytochrome c-type biogenesis protein